MKSSLRGPSPTISPGFKNKVFIDELNDKGCYIHVISKSPGKMKEDLDKIEQRATPTPATHVGTAPFGLYNETGQWDGCSGLVFSPDTVSLLSHKHDFWSNRLNHCKKDLRSFNGLFGITFSAKEPVERYAKYVSKKFNGLNQPTKSFFYNNPGKVLDLKEDMARTRAKYDEMKFRACRDKWNAGGDENSSKFVIFDLLHQRVQNPHTLTKARLIQEIEAIIREKPHLRTILCHPLLKIRQFGEVRLAEYMAKSQNNTLRQKKKNFYSNYFQQNQKLAPNEHLVLPHTNEICGVYVNTALQAGIDRAYDIFTALKSRQAANGAQKYLYAIAYQPLNSPDRPIYMATWAHAVRPWTTAGLIEFAKTGKVTADDGKKFNPNHFELPKMIGHVTNGNQFIDDLSAIRSGRDNLLHLAVKSGRSANVVKFFLLWKVSPSDTGEDLYSARSLALTRGGPVSTGFSMIEPANGEQARMQFMRDNPRGVR